MVNKSKTTDTVPSTRSKKKRKKSKKTEENLVITSQKQFGAQNFQYQINQNTIKGKKKSHSNKKKKRSKKKVW